MTINQICKQFMRQLQIIVITAKIRLNITIDIAILLTKCSSKSEFLN